MINPAVLKRFYHVLVAARTNRFLKNTVTEIEQYTGQNYLIEKTPILRVFMTKKKKNYG